MRTFAIVLFGALAGLVIQSTLPQFGTPAWARPDIMLILCVYLGLHRHTAGGAFGAFVLGYVEDNASGSTAGIHAFAMSLVFFLVYLTSRRLWVENIASRVVVVFLAGMIKMAAVVVLAVWLVPERSEWQGLLPAVLAQSAISAALAPPVFYLLRHPVPREDGAKD